MKLECHYCKRDPVNRVQDVPVRITIHDKRGCFHVCDRHARWRLETSLIGGHSKSCPYNVEPQ